MNSRRPIDATELRDTLGTRWPRIDVVASTTSTNADLVNDDAAPDRTVLVAELQTAGRGRLDRTWTSREGAGLTFSVLLRPPVPVPSWGWVPLLAGLALHDVVAGLAAVTLKWPNDLLARADGTKLAGVLAQTSGDAVVVGIGLNVSTTRDELPVDSATSLRLQGASADRTELLGEILSRLDECYEAWASSGGDAEACGLAGAYRHACATIGQTVSVALPDETIRGTAVDVDEGGRLVVDVGGTRRAIAAGDVTHLRADGA